MTGDHHPAAPPPAAPPNPALTAAPPARPDATLPEPWFLGPKGENAPLLQALLGAVVAENASLRASTWPDDPSPWPAGQGDGARLRRDLDDLLGRLRWTLPFYSPRWQAHQQADPLLASTVGVLAGTIGNGNIISTESAPAAVELEIEAVADLLTMLGYTPPPDVTLAPDPYRAARRAGFSWGHLTSGGTTANIEALWVARATRYLPLTVQAIAELRHLTVEVKLPGRKIPEPDIRYCPAAALLRMAPADALRLVADLTAAVMKTLPDAAHGTRKGERAAQAVTELLHDPDIAAAASYPAVAAAHRPVIFAPGTAHYSIEKAADLLGIGRGNIEWIDVDSSFRMHIGDLATKLRAAHAAGRAVVAVVAVAGTTEEGAVDPVHRVVALRDQLERDTGAGFWIHLDAAWGGYFRSLVTEDRTDVLSRTVTRAAVEINIRTGERFGPTTPARDWVARFRATLARRVTRITDRAAAGDTALRQDLDAARDAAHWFRQLADPGTGDSTLAYVVWITARWYLEHPDPGSGHRRPPPVDWNTRRYRALTDQDWLMITAADSTDDPAHTDTPPGNDGDGDGGADPLARDLAVTDQAARLIGPLLAFGQADSITVDPHKMGYLAYPAGLVAFRHDQVRDLIAQRAPYITATGQGRPVGDRAPLRHRTTDDPDRIYLDSPAVWTLEGSRPASAASSLWLAGRTVPPTRSGYGPLLTRSLRSARHLHDLLGGHAATTGPGGAGRAFRFVPLLQGGPDTNIVVFAVRPGAPPDPVTLAHTNDLGRRLYAALSIRTENGDTDPVTDRPRFVSSTTMDAPRYPLASVEPALLHAGVLITGQDYHSHGLFVLRAVVANPYLTDLHRATGRDVLADWVDDVAAAAAALA